MTLLELQFSRILDRDDALGLINIGGHCVEQSRLARTGPARDKDISSRHDDGAENFSNRFRDAAIFNQCCHVDRNLGELADGERRPVNGQWGHYSVDARSVSEPRIDKGRGFIDPAPDCSNDLLDDAQKMFFILEADGRFLELALAFDKNLIMAVDQNIGDGLILEERLKRP